MDGGVDGNCDAMRACDGMPETDGEMERWRDG